MKQVFTLTALALLVILLAQCSPKTPASTTTKNNTHPATTNAASAAALAEGQAIFQASCGRCHKLFAPESRTVAQWNRILPEMYHKSKLAGEQSVLVEQYVMANAKKG